MPRSYKWLAGPIMVVLVSGCASGSGGSPQPGVARGSTLSFRTGASFSAGATTTAGSTDDSDAVRTPDDGLPKNLEHAAVISDEDYRVVLDAQEALVGKCMTAKGFDYERASFAPSSSGPGALLYPSTALIRERGYAWRATLVDAALPKDSTQKPKAYRDALEGTDGHPGCGVAAYEMLRLAKYYEAQQVFFNADAELRKRIYVDARWQQSLNSWTQCMTTGGYTFGSPDDAERAAGESGSDTTIAQRDYACRRSAMLEELRLQIGKELTTQWIEANPQSLLELRQRISEVLEAAKRVLATS